MPNDSFLPEPKNIPPMPKIAPPCAEPLRVEQPEGHVVAEIPFGPRDVLVLMHPGLIDADIATSLRDQILAAITGEARVLVLGDGLTLKVLHRPEGA